VPRLFVAVWPPPPIVELLAGLPRPEEPGVRWTVPDQWHVTVRFMGDADEESAAEALTSVTAAATTATLGPRVSRLGRSVIVVPVAGLDSVAAEVYLGWPDNDPTAPPEQVPVMEKALTDAGVTYTLDFLTDAVHGYAPPGGDRYNREASELHWERVHSMFRRHLW